MKIKQKQFGDPVQPDEVPHAEPPEPAPETQAREPAIPQLPASEPLQLLDPAIADRLENNLAGGARRPIDGAEAEPEEVDDEGADSARPAERD